MSCTKKTRELLSSSDCTIPCGHNEELPMASKRNPKGCTSLKCVEDAMQKCDCGALIFFIHASIVKGSPPGFNVNLAAEQFTKFRHHGSVVYPDYEIPVCVLRFADMIHSSKCPLQLLRDLQAVARLSMAEAKAPMRATAPALA